MSDESFRPKNPPSPAKSRSKTHSSPAKSASSLTSSPQRVQVQEASGRLDNSALLIKRLKDAYGHNMPDSAAKYLVDIHTRCGLQKVDPAEGVYSKKKNLAGGTRWSATGGGTGGKGPARKVLGRDVDAMQGQVVYHIEGGKRPQGNKGAPCFGGDYYSGGGSGTNFMKGTIVDVCGDNALVRWFNGNERFYYVGKSPWRKDSNGLDTDNARGIRSLVLDE